MGILFRNFLRSWRSTLAALAVVTVMTVFLISFLGSIATNRERLQQAYDTLEVTAYFRGNGDKSPSIASEVVDTILESGFVKSYLLAAQFTVRAGDSYLRAVNVPETDSLLEKNLPNGQWLEGWDESLFQQEERVCLAPVASGYLPGDTAMLECVTGDVIELLVVGCYEGGGDDADLYYYCSIPALKSILGELGKSFSYCKMEMELQNLAHIDQFKAQMKELGLEESAARLMINDSLLRQVTDQLRQQIRLMERILPVLLLLVAAIGFGLSFLLARGQKKDFAVMRLLGESVSRVTLKALCMQAGLCAVGIVLGLVCMLLTGQTDLHPESCGLLLVCYCLGAVIAAYLTVRVDVMQVLRDREG